MDTMTDDKRTAWLSCKHFCACTSSAWLGCNASSTLNILVDNTMAENLHAISPPENKVGAEETVNVEVTPRIEKLFHSKFFTFYDKNPHIIRRKKYKCSKREHTVHTKIDHVAHSTSHHSQQRRK